MEHDDQLQDGFFAWFFTTWGLYYGQDFSSAKVQRYMKNDMVTNLAALFARGVFIEVKYIGQFQTLVQDT